MFQRRDILKAGAGLPLAAILADPALAQATASGLRTVSVTLPSGRVISAALAEPARLPAGSIILIHEWWGLNDQIKTMAAEFAREGYRALVVDLFNGSVAATPEGARANVQGVKPDEAHDTLRVWAQWLRGQTGNNGKLAVLGWCFGGGWALNASLAVPVEATVIYYGNVAKSAADLAPLKGPVLGHFGLKDQSINPAMVQGFEAAMKAAGKPLELYNYDADHAFANPTTARYDEGAAKLSWERTRAFLKKHIA